jgi:hypothetical protein
VLHVITLACFYVGTLERLNEVTSLRDNERLNPPSNPPSLGGTKTGRRAKLGKVAFFNLEKNLQTVKRPGPWGMK